jgi:hypothetical protein
MESIVSLPLKATVAVGFLYLQLILQITVFNVVSMILSDDTPMSPRKHMLGNVRKAIWVLGFKTASQKSVWHIATIKINFLVE